MINTEKKKNLERRKRKGRALAWKILKRQRSRKETAVLRCIVRVRPEVGRLSSSTSCVVGWGEGVGWRFGECGEGSLDGYRSIHRRQRQGREGQKPTNHTWTGRSKTENTKTSRCRYGQGWTDLVEDAEADDAVVHRGVQELAHLIKKRFGV